MEKKEKIIEKENGSYEKVSTTKTKPSDGFVHQVEVNRTSRSNYGEYHKGWQVDKHYETDDPRKTIPFLILFMILVLVFPVGAYFLDPSGNHTIAYAFLVVAIVFEIFIVREIIGIIKKHKK